MSRAAGPLIGMFVRIVCVCLALVGVAHAGPETSLREYASSQIKKGVRVLGMGGDGATWGNYSLVYRETNAAIADYGITHFTDTGNDIHFIAVGFSTPPFWKNAGFYVVAMAEWAQGLRLNLKSPAFPNGAPMVAEGTDQAIFVKFAKALGHGFAIGVLFGWERSELTATAKDGGSLTYSTSYLPSVGAGVSWEPTRWLLTGLRVILNNDDETRRDAISVKSGWLRSWEFRAGLSVRAWRGAIFDVGYVGLWRSSVVANTESYTHALVAGYEQELWPKHLTVRVGWNETSPTAGISARFHPFKLDVAYVHDLGIERSAGVFGHEAHSVIGALTFDYARHH